MDEPRLTIGALTPYRSTAGCIELGTCSHNFQAAHAAAAHGALV